MGSGGGSSGSNKQSEKTEIRYAPYVEAQHSAFLDIVATKRDATLSASPFGVFSDIVIDNAFFGTGFIISNFPALYDMYGKFMAGLDVEALYGEILEDSVNHPEINQLVSAEAALLDDDIKINSLPRLQVGMRDINSVMSSSFVVGKAVIEDARVKSISKFSAQLKYDMLPISVERWKSHLEWNRNVVFIYAELMKLYYAVATDVADFNYGMKAKHLLWPFTVLEFNRAALGALQAATNTRTEVAGGGKGSQAIAGALSGAASGAMMGAQMGKLLGPHSTAIGAAAGGLLGIAGAFF